jgi:hypothetical protein
MSPIDRRQFVSRSLLTLGVSSLVKHGEQCWATGPEVADQTSRYSIEYPRKEIPSFAIPPYRGHSYEDTIPDTLDVASRAELAIHALTSIADPRVDDEVYWFADFFRNPPVMVHDYNDWVLTAEGMMEALPLLRIATGSSLNENVDPVWMRVALQSIGADGLIYNPLGGLPWSRIKPSFSTPIWRPDGTTTGIDDPSVRQVTTSSKCGRMLNTFTAYYLRDHNPVWKETIERMIQRLNALAVKRDNYCYLPKGGVEVNAKFGPSAEMPTGIAAIEGGVLRLIQGLSKYYKATGYEPARELAARLVIFAREGSECYDAQGRFLFSPAEKQRMRLRFSDIDGQQLGGHFHSRTLGLLNILDYGLTVGDKEQIDFVRSGFEWARTQGSSLVGFFPEYIVGGDRYPSVESCEVGEMITLGLKLSVAGAGDYWDDVDRWVRNQFAENQLTKSDWIYSMAGSMEKKPVGFNESDDRVGERNLGAFAGWASGNEWAVRAGIMHCCTGNCACTLYYLWEHMLAYDQERLRVNLLLNRASQWADVYSYIPYEGRVDIKVKQPCKDVLVRVPEWVHQDSQIVCKHNGASQSLHWEGRFLSVGKASEGDRISITFPIEERTVREKIGGVPYTLTLRGSTVISIDPPGKNGPLYASANYRDQVGRRKVTRFISQERIDW